MSRTIDFNQEGYTLGQIISIITALFFGVLAAMTIMPHPIMGFSFILLMIFVAFMNTKFFLEKVMGYKVIDYYKEK